MRERLSVARTLPADAAHAVLVGRVHLPSVDGPALVTVVGDAVHDITSLAPTASALLELDKPAEAVRGASRAPRIGDLAEVLANTPPDTRDASKPWLLTPCD